MAMIKDNIARLNDNISLICRRLGRDSREITVVCITKLASVLMIEGALACGMTDIGENRVQEVLKKYPSLKSAHPIRKHMVGHLQMNKVKDALKIFDMIQSVDSLRLAEAIERTASDLNRPVDALVQVNASGEKQKFGVSENEAMPLLKEISRFEHIRVLGLMTIAPFVDNEEVIRNCFRKLRQLRDRTRDELSGCKNIEMKFLSMGMTDDYTIALEEGANMIRIGRGIFSHV